MLTNGNTSWLLLAFCVFASFFSKADAQLDPKLTTPYQFEIVVHFDDQSIFTDAFKYEVKNQLRFLLQRTYDKLAEVNVLSAHPALEEIRQKGLEKVLDSWSQLSAKKTHFVLIDFKAGVYHLQTRQYDGSTATASPQVRRQSTEDRGQVARLAALMIDLDFGPTAAVTGAQGDTVEIAVQGGGLGVDLNRWIQRGDVFAVSRILQAGAQQQAERLEKTLLQVQSEIRPGHYRCKWYTSRFEPGKLHQGADVLGYRCLKLTTIEVKPAFHLVAENGNQPLSMLQIEIGEDGFTSEGIEINVDASGRGKSPEPFSKAIFVRVTIAGSDTLLAEFPAPVVDDKVITCRISLSRQLVKASALEGRYLRWIRQIYEALSLASYRAAALKQTLDKSPEKALQLAQSGVSSLQAQLARFRQERNDLQTAAGKSDVALDFNTGKELLQELAGRKAELESFVTKLNQFIKEDAKTKKIKSMITQASLLESQAKYQEAIEVYRKILEIREEEAVSARLNKLQTEWSQDRGEAHKVARKFMYETWPEKMDVSALKAALPKAKDAFETCEKVKDRLSPRKMIHANVEHALYLQKRLEVLKRSAASEDNRNEIETILELAEELQALHNEVKAWVEQE